MVRLVEFKVIISLGLGAAILAGIFITKAIVEAHRGSIVGYNNPKGGATFQINLPIGYNQLKLANEVVIPAEMSK